MSVVENSWQNNEPNIAPFLPNSRLCVVYMYFACETEKHKNLDLFS